MASTPPMRALDHADNGRSSTLSESPEAGISAPLFAETPWATVEPVNSSNQRPFCDGTPRFADSWQISIRYRLGRACYARETTDCISRIPPFLELLLSHSHSYDVVIVPKQIHVQIMPSVMCTSRSATKSGVFVKTISAKKLHATANSLPFRGQGGC